jgi:hypothetical protein
MASSLRVRSAGWAVVLTAAALVFGPASAASATDWPLIFDDPRTQTVTYGTGWGFPYQTNGVFSAGAPVTEEISGPVEASRVFGGLQYDSAAGTSVRVLLPPRDQPPTPAGDYSVFATLRTFVGGVDYVGVTSAPARLIVEPAALVSSHTLAVSESAPGVAIVSMELSGAYVDDWGWTSAFAEDTLEPSIARIPGGVWTISIIDSKGETVSETVIERATGLPASFSVPITGLPAEADLTSTVEFAPETAARGNFVVTSDGNRPVVTTAPTRPLPQTPVVDSDAGEPVGAGAVALPVWGIVVMVMITALLVAAAVVILRPRRPALHDDTVAAGAVAESTVLTEPTERP